MITFAHDLPTEVNNKLKEYKNIKKALKDKQVRFQTPYPAKMRIHWENGPRLYNNATEAAEDMRKRGYSLDPMQPADTDWEKRLTQSACWSGGDGGRSNTHSERIRDKLRSYQRK